MAHKSSMSKSSSTPPDLTPYRGSPTDAQIGLEPLAVGFLNGRPDYPQGKPPTGLVAKLAKFCEPACWVDVVPKPRPCPLCQQTIPPDNLGAAQIRVIGEEEIFAAPALILHYITAHQYLPPEPFCEAVLNGPPPDSSEYRALLRALRG
jgi:hypothetical protein